MSAEINDKNIIAANPYYVRRLQCEILKIYETFRSFCERHNLRFYGLYGTVLGAVRHNGFIPWDDDMDVAMPRRDYNQFLELIEAELPEDMALVSYDRTPGYTNMFAKVVLLNPEIVKSIEDELECRLPEGIYLDIFPIDGLPNTFAKRIWHLFRRSILKTMQYSNIKSHPPKNVVISLVGKVLHYLYKNSWYSANSIQEYMDKHVAILEENDFYSSQYVAELGWIIKEFQAIKNIDRFPSEIWGNPQWMAFEETKVSVPENAKEYLTNTYGNYMQLPPIEKRKPSHCKKS